MTRKPEAPEILQLEADSIPGVGWGGGASWRFGLAKSLAGASGFHHPALSCEGIERPWVVRPGSWCLALTGGTFLLYWDSSIVECFEWC